MNAKRIYVLIHSIARRTISHSVL